MDTVRAIGRDSIGQLAECDGVIYYLTDCCKASAKGSEIGVVCRSCYREIDPALGMGWTSAEWEAHKPADFTAI